MAPPFRGMTCVIGLMAKKDAVRPIREYRVLIGSQYSGAEAANTGKSNEGLVSITLHTLYSVNLVLSMEKHNI